MAIALRTIVSRSTGIAGLSRRGGRRLLEGDPPQDLLAVPPRVGRPQRQQLVERHAQRVDVGAVVDDHPLGQRLLGAHVAERAEQVAGHRQPGVALDAGQAEVGDPEVAARVDQQVRRLDVAVQDPLLVRVLERLGRLESRGGPTVRKKARGAGRSLGRAIAAASVCRGGSARRPRGLLDAYGCGRRIVSGPVAVGGEPARGELAGQREGQLVLRLGLRSAGIGPRSSRSSRR